jgi:hypothetical protein
MRTTLRLLPALLLCLLPAVSEAVNVPLPIKEATLNLQVHIQPRFQLTEDGSPSGQDPAYDFFVRRTRIQANGNIGPNWLYLFQVDNANFGRYGNFTSRMIVQDAWASWGPFGTKGDNVLLLEGGLLFFPTSRFTINSSNNYPSMDGHPDLLRGLTNFPGNRTTGVQVRGWWFNKKLGFRGGVYEGVQPQANPAAPVNPPFNPKRYPAFAGFVNFDIIGSEEGTYLYQGILFGKDPVLSVSLAGSYQADAQRTLKGVANMRSLTSVVFLDYPLSEQQELVAIVGGYLYGMGTGSPNTGKGLSLDVGFRYQFVRPYISWEYFNSDDCTAEAGVVTAAQCAQAHTADSRNFRAGLDFYINKAQNHVILEFSLNRGQSGVGPQSITTATAGYAPAVRAGEQPFTSLGRPASKTLQLQWVVVF